MKVSVLYHFNALMKAERRHNKDLNQEIRRAVKIALTSIDSRLMILNELRGDVATKGDLKGALDRITDLVGRQDRAEGRGAGKAQAWQILIGVAALMGAGVGAIAFIMSRGAGHV